MHVGGKVGWRDRSTEDPGEPLAQPYLVVGQPDSGSGLAAGTQVQPLAGRPEAGLTGVQLAHAPMLLEGLWHFRDSRLPIHRTDTFPTEENIMGYNVTMECDVTIHEPNFPQVIEAARKLLADHADNTGRYGHFAWGDERAMEQALDAGDLIGFFAEWRYSARLITSDADDSVRLEVEYFEGDKLGDDEYLWAALGPFIEKGGQIQCQGEDGALWRWYFTGTECVEQSGRVVYE